MRNTYTTAARAAHAPGDDTLARALKEALNSRALRARPSGHKCIDPARLRAGEAIPADTYSVSASLAWYRLYSAIDPTAQQTKWITEVRAVAPKCKLCEPD